MLDVLDDALQKFQPDPAIENATKEHDKEFSLSSQEAPSPILETLKASLKEKAEIDHNKIAYWKTTIALGQYQINEHSIAEKMLDPIELV